VRIRHRPFAAALVAAALFFTGQAAWIPAKAWLGQQLLERAWQARLGGMLDARPWPWADARPVAELQIPRLGLRQLVLDGASGRHLAWAPGALTPVTGSDVILSAHRDTHFAALANISPGDEIVLRDESGERRYRVAWLDIVDSRRQELVTLGDRDRLTLVTCYPFDAATAGGPLRLVVTALLQDPESVGEAAAPAPPSASHRATLSSTTR
jgi:sortase A